MRALLERAVIFVAIVIVISDLLSFVIEAMGSAQ
jgi:hypothetical protein